jgi:hypothetical protein
MSVENITQKGFELNFLTWSDTHIARASISWQACGPDLSKVPPQRPKEVMTKTLKKNEGKPTF